MRMGANIISTLLHIAFGVDRNYVPAMGVTIISIVTNNPETDFVFHVVAETLPPEDLEIIERLAKQIGSPIRVHMLDHTALAAIPGKKSQVYAIYYRLFLCELLKNDAAHVLYLDADIVCLRALPPLPELGGAIAAVVMDTDQHARNAALNRPEATPYFNSGVMYMNVRNWNEDNITRKVLNVLSSHAAFRFPDLDALNLVLENKIVWLDGRWNQMWEVFAGVPTAYANTVFLHYAGEKPWHEWRSAFLDPPFAQHFQQSPWPTCRLLIPHTRKNKLQYARHLFKRGNFLKASLWYIRFLGTRRRQTVGYPHSGLTQ